MDVQDQLEDTRAVKIEAKNVEEKAPSRAPSRKGKRTRTMSEKALSALQRARDQRVMNSYKRKSKKAFVDRTMKKIRKQFEDTMKKGGDLSRYEAFFKEGDDVSQSNTPASSLVAQDVAKPKYNSASVNPEQLLQDIEEKKSYMGGEPETKIAPISGRGGDHPVKDDKDKLIEDMRKEMELMNKQIQEFNKPKPVTNRQGIYYD